MYLKCFHPNYYASVPSCIDLVDGGIDVRPCRSEMNHPSPFGVTRAKDKLLSNTGIHHNHHSHKITMELFTKGFYRVGFDLSTDREDDEEHVNLSH
jgi:hypothetical protein